MKLILSLGTNLGNKKQIIISTVRLLEKEFNCEAYMSRFFESPPLGPQDQPSFLNIALEINTCLKNSPEKILEICKNIEKALGRQKRYHWGPREIDIDIIFIDKIELTTDRLTIPHKEFRKRSFVLEPLKDLPSYLEFKEYFKIEDVSPCMAKPIL